LLFSGGSEYVAVWLRTAFAEQPREETLVMADVQKPSIGRIVHYYDPKIARPFAAIVVDTIDEDDDLSSPMHVNLVVIAGAKFESDVETEDVPYSETRTKSARWCWPPRV